MFIKDMDDDIIWKVLKFADDTKVYRKIQNYANRKHLKK